ncbi:DUF3828 domain-containing protein [Acetobacter sacchari]|uniref:DUF3828 domain-containing protein n=1 Tax=Acetobacter sacchari TaxID=2661687 RepID=A0ABS3LSY0_9PROT|nr:DUF3828 domain-containing protein [Acetobacter sacchari]MBO1359023.1 DUF3828 domain-containing protein [Acetobacter sacchari]
MRASVLSALAILCGGALGSPAIASEASPATQASDFYHWYLAQPGAAEPAFMETKIKEFVTPELVTKLRAIYKANDFAEGADYFLKVQDYDEKYWKKHIDVSTPITSGQQILELVTLGSVGKAALCVHFRKVGTSWKIFGVDEPDLKTAPANCRTHITEEPAQ